MGDGLNPSSLSLNLHPESITESVSVLFPPWIFEKAFDFTMEAELRIVAGTAGTPEEPTQ